MIRRILLLLILCFMLIPAASGQDTQEIPLIAIFNGEFYELEGDTLVDYDVCEPDEELIGQYIQSPDGTRFLIMTRPKIVQQALVAFGSLGDIAYGVNLWLCDTSNDTLERILVQPNADDEFADELPNSEKVESPPAWSPDGTQIAWSQLQLIGEANAVVIYDVATGTTQEYAVELPPALFPAPAGLAWLDSGIYLSVFTMDDFTFVNIEKLYAFNVEAGGLVNEIIFYDGGETSDFIAERVFAKQGERTFLALRYYNGAWVLVDVESGEQTVLGDFPELYNPMIPDSVALEMDVDFEYNVQWELVGDSAFELAAYPFQRVALAPDGSGFAYADAVLHIWRDGEIIDIANSDGFADDLRATVLWLPTTWRVSDATSSSDAAEIVSCEGAPESRLQLGSEAITTINLNVRDNPSTTAEKIGEFLPEQIVTVVNGPECADGYAWYFVQASGVNGWVAEGAGENYFIAPLNG